MTFFHLPKLKILLPQIILHTLECKYLSFFIRSVTMRGTLQNNCNLYQPVMHPYPARIQLLATKMLANTGAYIPLSFNLAFSLSHTHTHIHSIYINPNSLFTFAGHNSLEGDHSTDTTTMTAVSNSGAADSSGASGSGGNNMGVGGGSMYATAGSEHTYHRHLYCCMC